MNVLVTSESTPLLYPLLEWIVGQYRVFVAVARECVTFPFIQIALSGDVKCNVFI